MLCCKNSLRGIFCHENTKLQNNLIRRDAADKLGVSGLIQMITNQATLPSRSNFGTDTFFSVSRKHLFVAAFSHFKLYSTMIVCLISGEVVFSL